MIFFKNTIYFIETLVFRESIMLGAWCFRNKNLLFIAPNIMAFFKVPLSPALGAVLQIYLVAMDRLRSIESSVSVFSSPEPKAHW